MDNSLLTLANLEKAYNKSNFQLLKNGEVNIAAIRVKAGEFNDLFFYFKYENGIPIILPAIFGTTEPGKGYLKEKLGNAQGTAILIHDRQYLDCWQIGKHKGHPALTQSSKAKFAVWRDSNKDGVVTYGGKEYFNVAGLNNHTTREGYNIDSVGTWSAGCQVIWNAKSFDEEIFPFCKATGQKYFNYTLFLDETFIKLIN